MCVRARACVSTLMIFIFSKGILSKKSVRICTFVLGACRNVSVETDVNIKINKMNK